MKFFSVIFDGKFDRKLGSAIELSPSRANFVEWPPVVSSGGLPLVTKLADSRAECCMSVISCFVPSYAEQTFQAAAKQKQDEMLT